MSSVKSGSKEFAETTLRVVMASHLTADDWENVQIEVEDLESALRADDSDAFDMARARLEKLSGARLVNPWAKKVEEAGSEKATVPPPAEVKVRLNEMVRSLLPQVNNK